MKRIGFVSCFLGLIGLMGLTGCQRTPEERIIGYLDDVVQIVVDTADCEKAAKDIEKYTETKKGRIKDDIKAVIVRTKDDKNSSKELKKRLEKQWDELKDNAQDSTCMEDDEVVEALADFSVMVFSALTVSALEVFSDTLSEKFNEEN